MWPWRYRVLGRERCYPARRWCLSGALWTRMTCLRALRRLHGPWCAWLPCREWDWAGQTYGVARRDAAANVMKIDGAGSPYGIKDGQRLRVENSLTELDMPGEWYLDRSHARLYFWPPDTLNKADVEIAVATSLL